MFGGKGTLIQPTPQNKPKSTVTIIDFVSSPAVNRSQIFVDYDDLLEQSASGRAIRRRTQSP